MSLSADSRTVIVSRSDSSVIEEGLLHNGFRLARIADSQSAAGFCSFTGFSSPVLPPSGRRYAVVLDTEK